MTVSNERLEEISSNCTLQFGSISIGECEQMAKELLALRKAFTEPHGYEWVNDGQTVNCLKHNPLVGSWSTEYWGSKGFSAIPLYRKPTLP